MPDDTHDPERASSMADALREWKDRRAERVQQERLECDHAEHEHGICLNCSKDITDDLVARAEAAADSREDC